MNAAIRRGAKYFAVETTPTLQAAGANPLDGVDLVVEHAQPFLDRLGGLDERRGLRQSDACRPSCGRTG